MGRQAHFPKAGCIISPFGRYTHVMARQTANATKATRKLRSSLRLRDKGACIRKVPDALRTRENARSAASTESKRTQTRRSLGIGRWTTDGTAYA